MTPVQQALLAIEIAVDALHESGTESARYTLEQIGQLGFDTRPSKERRSKAEKTWAASVRRTKQPTLFPVWVLASAMHQLLQTSVPGIAGCSMAV